MSGDRVGDTTFFSAVYGFRPPALQFDYPKPDLRFFVEAVAENTSRGLHHGLEMQFSGGSAVLVGPTALLLYKAYGIEGGMLFPVYQQTNRLPEERFRFAVNFSYFFWCVDASATHDSLCSRLLDPGAGVCERRVSANRDQDPRDGLSDVCPCRAHGIAQD
jgi:hypothetical protein